MMFRVIDKRTGKEPDCYDCEQFALTEEWAQNLIYCDIEGFAITEDGALILCDECGNVAYCPQNRFKIIFEPAKWEQAEDSMYYCSKCKHEAYWDTDYGQQLFEYCPYCGSFMEEEV